LLLHPAALLSPSASAISQIALLPNDNAADAPERREKVTKDNEREG
jgi:hypothetical protein